MIFCFIYSTNAKADLSKCRDLEFQIKVEQVAKEEEVNSNKLLSIVAHESRWNYFVIAWNLSKAPQTAKNKFFESLVEAKHFTQELIATKKYRVDIGIGQINYEANIKRRGWTLDEVLDPKTALNRVTQVLKERGWNWYHSNNPSHAQKWRKSALNDLSHILSNFLFPMVKNQDALEKSEAKISDLNFKSTPVLTKKKAQAPLLVYNGFFMNSLILVESRFMSPFKKRGDALLMISDNKKLFLKIDQE